MDSVPEGSGGQAHPTRRLQAGQNKDDIPIYHSSINAEHVVEVSGDGRYGRLNTLLGKGGYKVVWKALDFQEGLEVAWNSFQTAKQELGDLTQEIEILKKVQHPNIIGLRDSWYSNGEFVFITELMSSGTLREYMQKYPKLDLKMIKSWTKQVLKGLLYLHSQEPPIIHRDIKCDNIFVNGSHGEVKIGDVGIAKMKPGKKYTVIGTPEFMAPEMYEEKGYNEKVDVYAFGMSLLEMVTGEYPYGECENAAQIYTKVTKGIKPECISRVENKEILSLIHLCIAPEPERISVREIFDHPLYAEDPDVVLLSVDEIRYKLTLLVGFRGPERKSFRFEYHLDRDSPDKVVEEMIEESILPDKYKMFVKNEIDKIIQGFHQRFPFAMETIKHNQQVDRGESDTAKAASILSMAPPTSGMNMESSEPPEHEAHEEGSVGDVSWKRGGRYRDELLRVQREMSLANQRALEAEKKTKDMESQIKSEEQQKLEAEEIITRLQSELDKISLEKGKSIRDESMYECHTYESAESNTSPGVFGGTPYSQMEELDEWTELASLETSVEELVKHVAQAFHRGPGKAEEWISRLHEQDIMTVRDLNELHEEDWANLNLTVFARRALKNAIRRGRTVSKSEVSPLPLQSAVNVLPETSNPGNECTEVDERNAEQLATEVSELDLGNAE